MNSIYESIIKSKSPASWKDIFVMQVEGRFFLIPSQSTALVESKSGEWVMNTLHGSFMLVDKKQDWLELIMQGEREFNVIPKTLDQSFLE